tara:strand:- start:51 stop:398 length:348 start_codon:yes stop_codon:yes gene_type:complete
MGLRCESAGCCDFRECCTFGLCGAPFSGCRAAVSVDGSFLGCLEFASQAATLGVNARLILAGTSQTHACILFRQVVRGRRSARAGHLGFECLCAASFGVRRSPRGPRRRAAALRL